MRGLGPGAGIRGMLMMGQGGGVKTANVLIDNSSGSTLTDCQIRVAVSYLPGMQSDFQDVRFQDGSILSCWRESYVTSTSAIFWVKVSSIPAGGLKTIKMLYGSGLANFSGVNTFKYFDSFDKPAEWTPYSGNPIITPDTGRFYATFSDVLKLGDTYHMYYLADPIGGYAVHHATSLDGKTWTKDANNPVLSPGGAGEWDQYGVGVTTVWIDGATWYMLYRGITTADGIDAMGLATSTDGVHWTKDTAHNPVLSPGGVGAWDHLGAEIGNAGVIKVGSTYYAYYECDYAGSRHVGVATSTDLISWIKDAANPILDGGRFCPTVFKRGSLYYMLCPHYTSGTDYAEIELYRCSTPTFYPADRVFVKIVKSTSASGWDSKDQDTPIVLTDDITRSTFAASNNQLWCYYAGNQAPDSWSTGLLIEPDIDSVLADPFAPLAAWALNLDLLYYPYTSTIKHSGTHSRNLHDTSGGSAPSLTTTSFSLTSGIIEMWMRVSASTGATQHSNFYFQENGGVKGIVGMNGVSGKFEYYNGSYQDTAVSYAVDTWYLLSVEFDCATDKYNFVVHDTSGNEIVRQSDIAFPSGATVINKLIITPNNAFIGDVYVDAFRVRSLAIPAPTVLIT